MGISFSWIHWLLSYKHFCVFSQIKSCENTSETHAATWQNKLAANLSQLGKTTNTFRHAIILMLYNGTFLVNVHLAFCYLTDCRSTIMLISKNSLGKITFGYPFSSKIIESKVL